MRIAGPWRSRSRFRPAKVDPPGATHASAAGRSPARDTVGPGTNHVPVEQLGSELVAVVDVAKTAADHACEGEVGIVGLIAVAAAWLGEHHYDLDIPEFSR